ncbi:polysaccharide deacetylase family protein [Paracoccus seriniphilus]|uniref:Chitooligosaccharide deacetylase n=2 Tax=Paracoccus seriniphilus TaxID=184748 RepID=A0A239PVK2_9RHOB|nr:polysaccharide deacetylase [Paracoccus seriniphilus]SNT73972.1 Polysaccharide deacetylase [Paracoccus seriniphilus]
MLDGALRHNPRYFTEGAYGPFRALPRLLDLLARHEMPATFFIPTWVVEQWTESCAAILRAGHEVAYHGHHHEFFRDLTPERQLEVMQRSREVFRSRLGVVPSGFRTPSGDWTAQTPSLLREFGIRYSSSMRGEDRPYFHPAPEGAVPLVELAGRWDMDDYTSLAYFEDPAFPTGHDRISDYRAVLANWCAEFEGYHAEGLFWTTILHPKVSAKPARLAILDGLFSTIRKHDDVWLTTLDQIARWSLQQAGYPAGQEPS